MSSPPRTSAAIVVALAFVLALGGSALAGAGVATKKVTPAKVKKIAKKQIAKAAPGLTVASAAGADSAYARALITVNPLRVNLGRNIEDGDVSNPRVGFYCFNVDFKPVNVQVTDETEGQAEQIIVSAVLDPASKVPRHGQARGSAFNACPAGIEFQVTTYDTSTSLYKDSSFFVEASR